MFVEDSGCASRRFLEDSQFPLRFLKSNPLRIRGRFLRDSLLYWLEEKENRRREKERIMLEKRRVKDEGKSQREKMEDANWRDKKMIE